MKHKKLLIVLLAVIISIMIVPAYVFASDNASESVLESRSGSASDSNVIKGKTNICGADGYDFTFDFKNLTTADNTKYSDQLSILSSLLSTDFLINDSVKVTDKDGYILDQLGFDTCSGKTINIYDIKQEAKNGDADKDDYVIYSLGRKELRENGKDYSVYVLAIRGTVDPEEWASDADFGADIPEYYDMIAPNKTEWNKPEYEHDHHKGFDVTGNRLISKLNAYMNKYAKEDENRQKTLLITGHSRGAAEADVVGKYFEDKYLKDGEIKPYTYSFGTPTTTTKAQNPANNYKTIFNICNEDDLVAYVPLTEWGFRHYGTDKWLSVKETPDLNREWKKDMFVNFTKEYFKLFAKDNAVGKSISDSGKNNAGSSFADYSNSSKLSYISGDGAEIEKILYDLFPGSSRENLFECTQLVWIPWNTPDRYKQYYEDAGYGTVDETKSKLSYYTFALKHGAKRVKVSKMFFMAAINNFIKSNENGVPIEQAVDFLKKLKENGNAQIDEKNVLKSIIRKCISDNDINYDKQESSDKINFDVADLKVCAYVLFCRMDDDQEYGDEYLSGIDELKDKLNVIGMMCSHMPTTYYQMVHYLAVKDLDAKKAEAVKQIRNLYERNKKHVPLLKSQFNEAQKTIRDVKYNTDLENALSEYKNKINSTVKKYKVPGTSVIKISKGKKKLTVKWKKQSSGILIAAGEKSRITGYQIRYSSNKRFKHSKIRTIKGYKKTTKRIGGLKAGKRYYAAVRTYIKSGKQVYCSEWSKVKSAKTKRQ